MARLIFLSVFVIYLIPDFSLQQITENFINKINETSSTTITSSKSRTLYDYQTRVVAYKDLIDSKCILEILNGPESQISNWMGSGRKNISKAFVVSNNLSKRKIWQLAGQRINEFCKGFPTFLIYGAAIENQNDDEVHMSDNIITRRKRQTRHYFQGRVRGQTQSQYLNFGKVDQPGKAEAESTLEGSKAAVSGNNGMGQAQSQTQPLGCDECYAPGYGQGSTGYDQGQTIDFGQGRPSQRFPGQISQQGPGQFGGGPGYIGGDFGSGGGRPEQLDRGRGGTRPTGGGRPGQFDENHGATVTGPGQFGGGGGEISRGPGQFGVGGGEISRGPGQTVQGPGQFNGGGGEISRGPGQTVQGPGQFGGGGGEISRGPGQIIQGPGQFGGGGGEISRGPGQTVQGPGQFGGGGGEISRGPGQTIQGPGQFGQGNGQINLGTDRGAGTEFVNGHADGEGGQIHGGPSQYGGRQPSEVTDLGVGGNGQFGGGSGVQTPGQIGGPVNGGGQTAGKPGRPGTFVDQNGIVGTGPGQSSGKPGQFGAENVDIRPGTTIGSVSRPELVAPHQPSNGGLPDYGITGTENIRISGQNGGVGIPSSSQQNGGVLGPDGRGKIQQIDQATGQMINLEDSVRKPAQYDGSFGGNLAGDYQNNLGQTGSFHGRFSGQYETAGYPYTGYVKPGTTVGQPGYVGHGTVGLQPGYGGTSYQPGLDGQYGVQHPATTGGGTNSKIYPPGYDSINYQPGISGQPSYVGQRPFQQPGQPNYGGQPIYSGQVPAQQLNGHDRVAGPYGQGLGTQGGGQYGVQRTPEQYQNGFQGGVPSGPGQAIFQPGPSGNGGQIGRGTDFGQPGYTDQYGINQGGLKPGVQGGPGYQPGIGINGNQGAPDSRQPYREPDYTGQNGEGRGQGSYGGPQGTGGISGRPNIYGTSLKPDGQGGYVDQQGVGKNDQYATGPNQYSTGIDGTPTQYTDQRYPSSTGQGSSSQLTDGAQDFDDSDSQVQTSVQQTENGTHAQAQAQGTYNGGTAQSQVSGVYSGSGSFSASAGSDDGKRGAQTQVSGGDYGAKSSAQGKGGLGQSQAQVILSSETGDTLSSAQSKGSNHGTQTQVQASERGGMADAQANGAGSTSSQAQIGFTPYDENDEDNQTTPFRGGGTAGAQSGLYAGMTQTQIQGKFRYGIKYTGAAQAGSGGTISGRNQTIKPGPFKPLDLPFYSGQNERSETHSQKQVNFQQTNKKIKDSTSSSSEDTTDTTYNRDHNVDTDGEAKVDTDGDHDVDTNEDHDVDNDEDDDEDSDDGYDENEYGQPGKPATRSIITQSSDNQRQHIILDPLEDLDATVHQSRGDFPADGTILQPGQYIPGSPGYKIPVGFRGTVKSISNGRNTYAIGKNSQAQSVTLSPGSGRIIYKRPVYAVSSNTHFRNGQYGYGSGYTYQPAYQPVKYLLKNGKVLPNFVSVSRSETGSKNLYTGKKTPNIYYTQSSSCGIFTNHCVFNAGKKICFPKVKTNPDGTIMGC